MITLENVSKSWKEFKLENINLEIKDGEFLVVLGPSGAGKTLLLEVIAGLHDVDKGEIYFGEKNVTRLLAEKRKVGFVFQEYALFPHKTVWQNIMYGLDRLKFKFEEKKALVEEFLNLLGIFHLAKRYPNTLSGGEKQRVALARALIINPQIFLLDEPLSALDHNIGVELREEIRKIHDKLKVTTVYVTHDRLEAFTLADRIVVMDKGKIIQIGTPEEVFRDPKTDFVAKFIGFENIFRGSAKYDEKQRIMKFNTGNLEIQVVSEKKDKQTACIRPENVIISNSPPKTSMRNVFEGKIIDIRDQGSFYKIEIDIGEIIITYITHQSLLELDIKINNQIFVSFKASAVKIL
ncbi:MAG: ABC transporter ATP-binding protein [Candidatus Lokiarchaeota archaeon]|nr:ABC transporter ATP-binding protein [Candidatus Lokiarchaeota archaeon]